MCAADGENDLSIGRLHVVVRGRVQGVNFRGHTLRRATKLGLVGYVRNQPDGTVEVVAEGQMSALRRLLSWLHSGPRLGHVSSVDVRWQTPRGDADRFEVRF